MDNISKLFSLIFFIAFVIYFNFGIYVIQRNPKLSLNKLFAAICASLCFWSLGFALAVVAPDAETCLMWRRVSALGWTTLYSILLNFLLVLTKSKLIKKRWFICLLHIPSFINVYIFSFSNVLTSLQYNLELTPSGWVNVAKNNILDNFFNLYYSTYIILAIYILFKWGKNSDSKENKKEASIIIYSLFFAFILGTLTDIILNSYLNVTVPQMAPIIILIPIFSMYYSIKKYGLINVKPIVNEELILNNETRLLIYSYISVSLILGGFLYVIIRHYIYGIFFTVALKYSLIYIVSGIAVLVILSLKISENSKDNIILSIISVFVPVTTLHFVKYASITVWAFPFILIIVFTLFNSRKMLAFLSLSVLITQVLVWIKTPSAYVLVETSDHFTRIVLFIIAIFMAYYVNKIYMLRLKENAEQIFANKFVAEISSDFVNCNMQNIEVKLNILLEKLGDFFNAERTSIFLFISELNEMSYSREWVKDNVQNELLITQDIDGINEIMHPNYIDKIKNNEIINVSEVEKLTENFADEKLFLKEKSIKSLIAVPISGNGKIKGYIKLDNISLKKELNDVQISTLKIISNVVSDALTKVNSEKKQNHMAYYDQLTNLANRVLFKDRLNQAIELVHRTNKMIGVIFLDLDSFKTINDTMGHDWGDELLKSVACELSSCVRKSDTVARFGGDEFLILINNITTEEDITIIADKVMEMFSKPFYIKCQEFYVTASAGVAICPMDGSNADDLIKNADIAMYSAKDKGKNRYVLCDTFMKDEVRRLNELSNSLYQALDNEELMLYYQPQINTQSKEIVGLEALLRWKHENLGMIEPGIFIPIAEKTGLINHIGEWVLKTACHQNKNWQERGYKAVRMAVNLSPTQFKNPNIVKIVSNILKESGMSPEFLELEITESVATKETSHILDTLNKLKNLGLSISIDDFGKEYSSLNRLKTLPVDRIKMDMQFVHGIDGTSKDQALAKVIINLAKSLDLKLVAEGVETSTQMEFLNQKMCDEMQGFYYYRPMIAEDVEKLLKKITDNS